MPHTGIGWASLYACSCGQTHHAFHSCNHRLCPQCGAADTAEWVDKQLGKLLPVPYFMVTFTLPEQLRPVLLGNRAAMELFFKCSSQALSCLLADPKRTGFERHGFFGVYQSWTQEMRFHPHIHYILPAVGLNAQDKLKHLKDPKFLIYAQQLANRLRTLFANALRDHGLIDARLFWQLVKMDWNASVDPAGRGENAVKYLGQYVQHSVISDNTTDSSCIEKLRPATACADIKKQAFGGFKSAESISIGPAKAAEKENKAVHVDAQK